MGGVIRVVVPGDPEWPGRLNELGPHRPPHRLYAAGRRLDPGAPAVAVVGTRRPTAAGIEAATLIAEGLAQAGVIVISGMAVGIDAAAHRAALAAGGATIAVLGCGIDVDYPSVHRRLKAAIADGGTVLSEYPAGTAPQRHHFPLRNRIIAGLSLGVVVVEGAVTSGALVTARLALDANRNVYAVPGSIRNPMAAGPNELIRTAQAQLVTGVEHIFEDLAPNLVAPPHHASGDRAPVPEVNEEEAGVLGALDDAPLMLDALAAQTGAPPGRLAILLSKLELRGMAARVRGGYVITASGARAREAVEAFPTNGVR